MRRRYKVLQSDAYRHARLRSVIGGLPINAAITEMMAQANQAEVVPVFNRPGLYYDRETKRAWHELPGGRAFAHSAAAFLFDLAELERGERPLTPAELKALAVLRLYASTPTRRKALAQIASTISVCGPNFRREVALSRMRVMKRLEAFKAKHELSVR